MGSTTFFKQGDFFLRTVVLTRVLTIVCCLLITLIYMENLLLLHPLIARLSTETATFFFFSSSSLPAFFFWMHSDVHFYFSSLSFSLLSASPSFVVARRRLLFAHFCFFRRRLAIQSFTSPSCRHHSRFVVPSSASHSFTSACRHHCRPANRLLQLLNSLSS